MTVNVEDMGLPISSLESRESFMMPELADK